MLRTAIAFSLTLATVSAHATDIYKCTDPAGKVEYRNSNCPTGTKSAALDLQATTGKTIEIRRAPEERVMRLDPDTQEVPGRVAPRKPDPVNALPPPPQGKEK